MSNESPGFNRADQMPAPRSRIFTFATKLWVVIIWIALWIPISTYFPLHPSFPCPQAAVPLGFLLLLDFPTGEMGAFKYIILHTVFFWGVLIAALRLRTVLFDRPRRLERGE